MKDEPIYELEVRRVVEETAEARSFVLALPESLTGTFRYRAGQFLTFELELAGRRLRRCYSMSSAPGIDPEIKFTVKRVTGGPASTWFNDQVKPGTRLKVLAPSGRFTLTESFGPPALLRRRQRHHAHHVADQDRAQREPRAAAPALRQPRPGRDHLRDRDRSLGGAPRRNAQARPSSGRRGRASRRRNGRGG